MSTRFFGRQDYRPSVGAADQVQAAHQPETREGAWAYDPANIGVARRRGSSVMDRRALFAAFALLATTARQFDPLNVCLYGVFGFLLKQ
jgi:hypothetical protein